MMNEFPPKYFQVARECFGSPMPAVNITAYLEMLAFRQWRADGMTARGAGDRRAGSCRSPEVLPPLMPGPPGHPLQHIVRFTAVNNLFACSWLTGSDQVHRP